MSLMQTSRTGLELIKSFEGFRPRAVKLGPDAGWVIGYGHTRSARASLRVSEEDAEAILRQYDLPVIEAHIAETVFAPLNQNEFDALISFVFNIGIEAFRGSDVLARLNSGEKLSAASAMSAWRKARMDGHLIVIDALVRRRAVEIALFLERPGGRLSAPTALLRPQLDIAASIMAPRERAVIVEENFNGDSLELRARGDASAHPANDTTDIIAGEDPSAPEVAARAVTERLSRILGETPSVTAPGHDISVDEITAAVSELADPTPESAMDAEVVDDLAPPVDVAGNDIQRALDVDKVVQSEDRFLDIMSWAPFAFLSFLGAAISGWGLLKVARFAEAGRTLDAGRMTAGPFLVLLGALLFIIMGYYLYQALEERN